MKFVTQESIVGRQRNVRSWNIAYHDYNDGKAQGVKIRTMK